MVDARFYAINHKYCKNPRKAIESCKSSKMWAVSMKFIRKYSLHSKINSIRLQITLSLNYLLIIDFLNLNIEKSEKSSLTTNYWMQPQFYVHHLDYTHIHSPSQKLRHELGVPRAAKYEHLICADQALMMVWFATLSKINKIQTIGCNWLKTIR